jgi:hypothetical protein
MFIIFNFPVTSSILLQDPASKKKKKFSFLLSIPRLTVYELSDTFMPISQSNLEIKLYDVVEARIIMQRFKSPEADCLWDSPLPSPLTSPCLNFLFCKVRRCTLLIS